MSTRRAALLSLLLLCGACTPNFEDVWLVKDLRILGLQTDPPEVLVPLDAQFPPNTFPTVHVQALAVDPAAGGSAELHWELWACPAGTPQGSTMPGATPTDAPRCDPGTLRQLVKQGSSLLSDIQADFVLDRDLYNTSLAVDPVKLGEVALGGVPVLLDLQVSSAELGSDRVVTRPVYGNPIPLPKTANANPQLDKILVDDTAQTALKVKPGQTVKLLPVPAASAAESYWVATFKGLCSVDADCDDGQAGAQCMGGICSRKLTEYLSYAFFTTAGTLSDATTGGKPSPFVDNKKIADPSSNWAAPGTPGQAQLWVVIRDDRGGISWQTLQAEISN